MATKFDAIMARRGEIMLHALGMDYSVFEQSPIAFDYEVHSLPTTYIIDKKGRIAAGHRGFWDRDSIQLAIRRAMK